MLLDHGQQLFFHGPVLSRTQIDYGRITTQHGAMLTQKTRDDCFVSPLTQ